ncbi:MAG: ABC transporter ATP-binding protein/permease [Candidatus Thiodiazotropha taylori]|nr:ABC transporter ATP-binding protein/permease [Candidatus Thiodiazotropha taylori]
MPKLFNKLYTLLDREQRRDIWFVLALTICMALLDTIGIASILPFITVLTDPGVVETNQFLKLVYNALGFTDIKDFQYALGIGTFALLVSSVVLRSVTLWFQLRFTNFGIHKTASRMVGVYLGQPYTWFLNRHSADLGTRVLAEVTNVYLYSYYTSMVIVSNLLVITFLVVLLFVVDPALAASSILVLGGAYFTVFWIVRKYMVLLGERRMQANHGRYRVLNEAFGGVKDVKASGLEGVFLNQFFGPSKKMAKQSVTSGIIAEVPSFALQGLVFGGVVLLLLYLMSNYGNLGSAIPVVAVYALAGFRLLPALQGIYRSMSQVKYNSPSLDLLYKEIHELELTSRKVERKTNNLDVKPLGFTEECKLKNIIFSYPGTTVPAIDNVNISIKVNSTIAFVGSSGSGKTTLVDIILGLLKPDKGVISLDNIELTDELLASWQKSIGYVSQNIFLSEGTIASNIAFGIPDDDIDMEAVSRAAAIAQLDTILIDLPDKLNTRIGEKGVRLSGGQRQRIGIARALYHSPSVLILDEATSALDNITELAVMDAIENLSGKMTIILIAHRLSSVRKCDAIYFLDKGKVLDSGSYDSLQETCVNFKQMVESGVIDS